MLGKLVFGLNLIDFRKIWRDVKRGKNSEPESRTNFSSVFHLGGIKLPAFNRSFSLKSFLNLTFHLTKYEFRQILGSTYFRIILMVGIIFMLATSGELGKLYDTETYPVTYQTIDYFSGTLYLFLLIIIVLYSGEIVWKERDKRVSEIHEALPTPNWVIFASKLLGLMAIQIVLLFLVLIIGVFIQATRGYYDFEIGLYLQELYTLQIIDLWLFCMFAFFVQVVLNNKYLGYFVYCDFLSL